MHEFGKTFRCLRKNKGFTMKEVATGIVSTHFLSDFEKGKSDISLTNFMALISRINISFEEISYAHNTPYFSEVSQFEKEISLYFEQGNKWLIDKLSQDYYRRYQDEQNDRFHHLSIMAKILAYGSSSVTTEEKNKIICYVKSVDVWGIYEFFLFTNLTTLFDVEYVKAIYQQQVKNCEKLLVKSPSSIVDPIELLLHTLIFFYFHDEGKEVKNVLELIKKYDNSNPRLLRTIGFKIYQEFLVAVIEEQSSGEDINKSDSILDFISSLKGYELITNTLFQTKKRILNKKNIE